MSRTVFAAVLLVVGLIAVGFAFPFVAGAPPQPHNFWGLARQSDGSTPLSMGTRVTAWVDGVDYSNGTSVYRADGAYDVDVFGDWVTQTGQPNTPAVKEGGNVGDEIMFVAGDFTTTAQVFTLKKLWGVPTPGTVENVDLTLAPAGNQPGLLKIARVVTRPADLLSQYLYICNPTASVINADGFYLQKDVPGSFSGPQHSLMGTGNIAPGGLAYVNLTGALTLVPTGDNLKLVWRNTGPAFGATDVIIDRLEFNQTGGAGTLFWEPGNTVMTDAPAPALGQEIRRTVACADTNNNAVDFTTAGETGRPGLNTAPTVTLTQPNGGQDWTGGTVHAIRWSMSDLESSSMTVSIALSVAPSDGFPISIVTSLYMNGANTYMWTVNLVNTTTARIRVCAFDGGGLSTCAISAADFTIDSARPVLQSTTPADGATSVNRNLAVVLRFSESMNRTATQGAVLIAPNPGGLVYTWSATTVVDDTLTVNHNTFAGDTDHTVTVNCGAKDDSNTGNLLANCPRSFSFRTELGAIAPTADLTAPDGGQRFSGGSSQTIAWTMNDADTPGNLNVDLNYSTNSGTTYPNAIATGLSRAQGANTFAWTVPTINTLTARVRVCVTDGMTAPVCDASAADFAIDSTRPTIVSVDPVNATVSVSPTKSLVIVFSEAMDRPATQSAFSISPNPGGLVYNWNAASDVLTITMSAMSLCTQHTATFTTGARDVSTPGNGLAVANFWRFTTMCRPQVTGIASPAGGEVWSGGSTQDVTFTLADQDDTNLNVWVNLSTDGGTNWVTVSTPVPAVMSVGVRTLQIPLPTGDAPNAIIRVTAQDSKFLEAGLTSPAFRIDGIAPTVTSSVPANAAQNVAVTADFTITFSEPMHRQSTEAAIQLDPLAAPLNFSWNAQSTVLTIRHATLTVNTPYTLAVQTTARDASLPGNAFASPHVITFRTSTVGAVVANPGGPYTVQAGTEIQFDGSQSIGTDLNYTWQVGTQIGYGVRPRFTFQSAGELTVSLTVRDPSGNVNTTGTTVTVTAPPREADFLSAYWWVFLILIVAIVAALLFLLGRRRKEEEMPVEVPPERVETIPPAAVKAPPRPPARPAAPPAKPAAPPVAPAAAPAKAKPATKECPNCGTIVDATDTDCFMCGAKL